MEELVKTDDPVFLSWLRTRLAEEGIDCLLFDTHTQAALGATLGAVGTRVMVDGDDLPAARRLLAEAEGLSRP